GATSLLAVPVMPIIMAWTVWTSASGTRLRRAGLYVAGAALPFLPVVWLAVRAPRQVLLDVVEFHLLYRGLGFEGVNLLLWNVKKVGAAVESSQAVLILVFFLIGLVRVARYGSRRLASELFLCASLAACLCLYLCIPMPTFRQYFVLAMPFASVISAI